MFRRIFLIGVALVIGMAVSQPSADAGSKKKKVRVCTEKTVKSGKKTRKKKVCRYEQEFTGHNAAKTTLRTEPLARPSGEIHVVSKNLSEELKVNIYRPDGALDEAALAQLDEIFRCKRSHEVRAVDPRLYEHLSRIYDHFGAKPIELVSGFRFQERDSSRHWHASAMDIRIDGVSIRDLKDYAESLDLGGMGVGIYPNSGFVHVDFRAPGEPSYRWVDRSYPEGSGKAKKSKSKKSKRRTTRARKPTS